MKPSLRETASALKLTGELLDTQTADYCFEGKFAFELGAGWSLVISADEADRFRLDMARGGRVRASRWCGAKDRARLRELVVEARSESFALVAG